MEAYRLTIEQKDILVGQIWGMDGQFFKPFQDSNDEWCISPQEVSGCTLLQAKAIGCDTWLTNLPLVNISLNPSDLPR